jgi:FMN phosphatase YigB (HAD superfamily)
MIMPLTQKISIVLSDVDGTLVDSKKKDHGTRQGGDPESQRRRNQIHRGKRALSARNDDGRGSDYCFCSIRCF